MTTMHARLIQIASVTIITATLTTDAHAQGNPVETAVSHMGVGAGITFTNPSSSDGQSSEGVALVYRWHTFHSGWGPTFGLDWHSNDFNQPLGSLSAPLGNLRTRALLAGFGHTQRLGKFSVSASVSGGYSFNDLSVDAGAGPAFATAGIPLLGVSVNNSAVVRPDISAWYDVGRHVGVGISAAYFVSRPDVTLTTATGSQVRELRADAFELTTGLVFGVWKKR
jgi:hypothetical protein